jgi:hypothetical protein
MWAKYAIVFYHVNEQMQNKYLFDSHAKKLAAL